MRFLTFLVLSLTTATAFAQEGSLSAKLATLTGVLPQEIQTGKNFVEQTVEVDADKPYVITVTQTEGAGKRLDVSAARVNLALLRRVRVASGRGDRLPVGLYANDESIAVADEDGDVKYASEFELLAVSTDNARELVALLEETLPLAQAAYAAATGMPEDAEGLRSFVAERVRDVAAGSGEYLQVIAFEPADGTGTLSVAGASNRDRESAYRFLMADLQGRSIEVRPRGGFVELTVPAVRGREYVELREEGELGFEKEVVIRFEDYDEAQLVREAFGKLTALAVERRKAAGQTLVSTAAATQQLTGAIGRTNLADVEQALEGECDVVLDVVESGRSEKASVYTFSFADLNARDLDVRPSRGAVNVKLSVEGGEKYIRRTVDGEAKGYADDVTLRFTSATDVQAALQAVEYLVANCPDPVASAPLTGSALVAAANVTGFSDSENEQSLTQADGKPCNYTAVLTERNGSKVKETEATFSLKDLDPRAAEVKVRGNEASVVFGTRRGERVIDVVDAGGKQAYEDEVTVLLPDMLTARRFLMGMRAAIEACE